MALQDAGSAILRTALLGVAAPVGAAALVLAVSELINRALMPALKELGFNRYQDELRTLMGDVPVMPLTQTSVDTAGAPTNSKSGKKQQGEAFDPGGLFAGIASQREVTAQDGEYRCVRTRADLDECLAALRKVAEKFPEARGSH